MDEFQQFNRGLNSPAAKHFSIVSDAAVIGGAILGQVTFGPLRRAWFSQGMASDLDRGQRNRAQ